MNPQGICIMEEGPGRGLGGLNPVSYLDEAGAESKIVWGVIILISFFIRFLFKSRYYFI